LLAAQTGLRLSDLIGLDRDAIHLGHGAHIRCVGKGRKERCTPLTTHARIALQSGAAVGHGHRHGAGARLHDRIFVERSSHDRLRPPVKVLREPHLYPFISSIC
jgi:site-specific recombinase XerC